jgi:hypothetical protein
MDVHETLRKILFLKALHLYIFRGRGTDPTIGFNDAERARP